MFELPDDIKKIQSDRLGQEHYTNDCKLTCIHLGMG